MNCVVCGAPIVEGGDRYANAWEAVRRKLPCCSDHCCARFDPEVHWFPTLTPPPAPPSEESRLLSLAAERLRAGVEPRLLVRELLLGGVSPDGVKRLLLGTLRDLGVIDQIFGKKKARVTEALSNVEAWEERDRPPTDP
jgi:hypothetical protein